RLSGGAPRRAFVPLLSPRVWSSVTPTVAATAAAAASATVVRIRARAFISGFSVTGPSIATFVKVMASYRELLQQIKGEIEEIDVARAREALDAIERPLVVDVREQDEWSEGRIPGAIHVPRGFLESRIEQAAPDRGQPIILYCAAGNR